jgi:hypothetical protein
MPSGFVMHTLGHVTDHVPGLRRLPVVKLLSAAEIALLAHDHLAHLTPAERRRLIALVRAGHGRRARLTESERRELETLLAKLAPRMFVGTAVDRLSPLPLPRRLLYGPARRQRPR